MKRILLSIFTVLSLAFITSAQDNIEIALSSNSTVDLSSGGPAHTVQVTEAGLVAVDFLVSNNTGSTVQWRITRLRINVPASWTDFLCWGHSTDPFGGTCYSASQMNTNPWTSNTGDVFNMNNGEQGKLVVDIHPDDFAGGSGHYRYYITNDGVSYLDSVDVILNSSLSVKEVKQDINFSIAPNPATDQISINLNGIENGSIKIVDVLGNVIYKDASFTNTKKVDVSNFKNGIYFVTIESNGVKAMTRKVVVRH